MPAGGPGQGYERGYPRDDHRLLLGTYIRDAEMRPMLSRQSQTPIARATKGAVAMIVSPTTPRLQTGG